MLVSETLGVEVTSLLCLECSWTLGARALSPCSTGFFSALQCAVAALLGPCREAATQSGGVSVSPSLMGPTVTGAAQDTIPTPIATVRRKARLLVAVSQRAGRRDASLWLNDSRGGLLGGTKRDAWQN